MEGLETQRHTARSEIEGLSLSLSPTHTLSLSLSLTHTHIHAHTHAHTHTQLAESVNESCLTFCFEFVRVRHTHRMRDLAPHFVRRHHRSTFSKVSSHCT